jgi:hypothetical protein
MHAREYRRRALDLYMEGWNFRRIAAELGVSARSVARWIKPEEFKLSAEQRQAQNERLRRRRLDEKASKLPEPMEGVLWLMGKGDLVVGATIVDQEDWERLRCFRWQRSAVGYPRAHIDGRMEYLHRMILGLVAGDGWQGDHINRNPMDNRRCNLRKVSPVENCANRGGRFTERAA